ncbi:unnamed protein product [Oikopleura dioica]|uniref:Uncharacterized protein n=1 Tax=Oikopleura dioica TaxID=34765 RepID=E4YLF1_OIKDI|nr:unnamed protein product [Oikopleura dioica]
MLKLLVAFFVFAEASLNLPSAFVRGRLVNRSCPDEDLALICDGHCYTDYLACKANCEGVGVTRYKNLYRVQKIVPGTKNLYRVQKFVPGNSEK